MKKWRCTVCGEIVESDVRPDKCPLCKAPGEKFVEVKEEEMTWAAEHVVGIGKKDASEEIIEGLRANFNGECTEVGMYLAMARVAHREGYPEIGLYWEKAAYEEAEHAAKFAELLGEVVTDSTKKNLSLIVMEEDHLCVLSAQLHRRADIGVQRPDSGRVGHHLLDIVGAQRGGNGPAAGTTYTDAEPGTEKPPGRFFQKLPDGGRLMGIVPLIPGKQHTVGLRVRDHGLHCSGPYIHTQPQDIGGCMYHMCSFRGNIRQGWSRRLKRTKAGLSNSLPTTIYSE